MNSETVAQTGRRIWIVMKIMLWEDLVMSAPMLPFKMRADVDKSFGQGFLRVFTDREAALEVAGSPEYVLEATIPRREGNDGGQQKS